MEIEKLYFKTVFNWRRLNRLNKTRNRIKREQKWGVYASSPRLDRSPQINYGVAQEGMKEEGRRKTEAWRSEWERERH